MGVAEGLQEVSESLALKLNSDMWNGTFFDQKEWENWTEEAKQEFFYGYLSGALFYCTALPSYAPSQTMLDGMISGKIETTPEALADFVAQVDADMKGGENKAIVEETLNEANDAQKVVQKVLEGKPIEAAREEVAEEKAASADPIEKAATMIVQEQAKEKAQEGTFDVDKGMHVVERDSAGNPNVISVGSDVDVNTLLNTIAGRQNDQTDVTKLYSLAASFDEKTGNAFKNNYESNRKLTPESYKVAFTDAFLGAVNGGTLEDVVSAAGKAGLNAEAATAAWNAGAKAAKQKPVQSKPKAPSSTSGNGLREVVIDLTGKSSDAKGNEEVKRSKGFQKELTKWAANEQVDVALDGTSPLGDVFTTFAKKWYDAGAIGTRSIDVLFENGVDTEFPPFLQDVFYKLGQKDTQKGQEKKQTKKNELTQSAGNDTLKADEADKGGLESGNEERVDAGQVLGASDAGTRRGGVLADVVQEELREPEQEGSGGSVSVLRGTGNKGAGSGDGSAAGAGVQRSDGDRARVSDANTRERLEEKSSSAAERDPQKPLEQVVAEDTEKKSTVSPKGNNYAIGDRLNLPSGEKARYKANVEAIQIIKQLKNENRYATAAEQETLSRYVGWGGIANVFDESKPEWAKENSQLKELLTKEEYESARASTLNAHYTSVDVIRAMYDGLDSLGFQGGRMLEPSCGVGNFVGAMPDSLQQKVNSWTMVELDGVTGDIAHHLYPNNDVRVQGFETAKMPNDYYDVAISNVPFGNYGVTEIKCA